MLSSVVAGPPRHQQTLDSEPFTPSALPSPQASSTPQQEAPQNEQKQKEPHVKQNSNVSECVP